MTELAIPAAAKDQLKSFVERIERLEEEKTAMSADIRELYADAKAKGFATKALRTVIRLRKMDADARQQLEGDVATYMHALGDAATLDGQDFASLPRRDTAEIEGVQH